MVKLVHWTINIAPLTDHWLFIPMVEQLISNAYTQRYTSNSFHTCFFFMNERKKRIVCVCFPSQNLTILTTEFFFCSLNLISNHYYRCQFRKTKPIFISCYKFDQVNSKEKHVQILNNKAQNHIRMHWMETAAARDEGKEKTML